MVRKRRATARAIRHNFVSLEEQVFVPEVFEDPPDRLDVVVGVGHVGVLQINPERDAVGEPFPILNVREHRFFAQLVEFINAVFFDLLFVFEAELFLHFDLDGQTVCVPAAAPRDVKSAHDLVAREQILERARQHVMHARLAVRGRRTFVENILRRAFALLSCLLENLALFPKFHHGFFHRSHVEFG